MPSVSNCKQPNNGNQLCIKFKSDNRGVDSRAYGFSVAFKQKGKKNHLPQGVSDKSMLNYQIIINQLNNNLDAMLLAVLTLLDVIYAAIKECMHNVKGTESGVWDSNAACINTDGSFECECKEGFTGSGFECEGISKHSIKLQLTVFFKSNISYHIEYGMRI